MNYWLLLFATNTPSSNQSGKERILNEFLIPWSDCPVFVYQTITFALSLYFIYFIFISIKEKDYKEGLFFLIRAFVLFSVAWHLNMPFKPGNFSVKVPIFGNTLIISNNKDNQTINYPCDFKKTIGECFNSFKENNK